MHTLTIAIIVHIILMLLILQYYIILYTAGRNSSTGIIQKLIKIIPKYIARNQ